MKILTDAIEELYEQSRKSPHKSLYLSVILQAILDATKKGEESEIRVYRDQAQAWLFTSIGVTCENFELVCDYAGLSPEYVRKFAHHVVNSDNLVYIRKKITTLLG
jgi:hypothetical protein